MKKNPQNDPPKKENAKPDQKAGGGPQQEKNPGGDPSYNPLQQKIDRLRTDRHAGETEMKDENRSGGSEA